MAKIALHPLKAWREACALCLTCDGSGRLHEDGEKPCFACDGTGRGWSGAVFGSKLAHKVTRQTVARWEAGRMPDQPYLDDIVTLTEGAVTANAWLGPAARKLVVRAAAMA